MQKKYKALIVLLLVLVVSGAIVFGYQQLAQQEADKPMPTEQQTTELQREQDAAAKAPQNNQIDKDIARATPHDDTEQHTASGQGGTRRTPSLAPARPHTAPQSSGATSQPINSTQPAQPTPQPNTPQIQPPTPPSTPPTQQPPTVPQPPIIPPTPPVQPPVTPTPPPQPPKPPVTPPKQNLTDEEKAKQLAESLKTNQNSNTAYFVNHDNQHRVALWTKGITAPRLGKNGELVHKVDGGYSYDYLPFNDHTRHMGWFDTDKSPNYSIADVNLCFAAVSANQLHWWMAQNKQRIAQYLVKTNYAANLPTDLLGGLQDLRTYQDSFNSQQDSAFFAMFKVYFGGNRDGYQVDPLNDLFINGYKPKPGGGVNEEDWPPEFKKDDRGGFFHEVFGRTLLTDRLTTRQFDYFSRQIKSALQQSKSVGVIYVKAGGYSHVITAWGAEFDPNGELTALYVTDSDDVGQDHNGLQRIGIKNIDGQAALSNNLDNPRHGSKIDGITTLSLGDKQWDDFLK